MDLGRLDQEVDPKVGSRKVDQGWIRRSELNDQRRESERIKREDERTKKRD